MKIRFFLVAIIFGLFPICLIAQEDSFSGATTQTVEIVDDTEVTNVTEVTEPLPTIPIDRFDYSAEAAGWTGTPFWKQQHEDINRLSQRKNPALVFLGDSITQSWGGPGRKVWKPANTIFRRYFAKYKALNYGISGDQTQHILWRIQNGNLDKISPKCIVLLIGTNNIPNGDKSNEIAQGIATICQEIEKRLPDTKILLHSIFPREDTDHPHRKKVEECNKILSTYADNETIFYLDLTSTFLNDDSSINFDLVSEDKLHLTVKGYKTWAKALKEPLKELMK